MGIRNISAWVGTGFLAVQPIGHPLPVLAHQIEVSGTVGGTAHIEPNDNPRAGTPSLTWFALTRQGGKLIPLADCTCKLSVYAQPRQSTDAPIQGPALKPVSADGYRDVPGADITFPQVGAYELVLQGEPKTSNDFQPFELTFQVTVAAGQTAPSAATDSTPTPGSIANAPAPRPATGVPNWLFWVIPLVALAIGVPLWLRFRKK